MFKVESLIEKEQELDQNSEDNKKAVCELISLIEEFVKKKPDTIRGPLFNHG